MKSNSFMLGVFIVLNLVIISWLLLRITPKEFFSDENDSISTTEVLHFDSTSVEGQEAGEFNEVEVVSDVLENLPNDPYLAYIEKLPATYQMEMERVNILKQESLEESIDLLTDIKWYMMQFGVGHMGGEPHRATFPMPPGRGENIPEAFMSSRRFLKVFGELEQIGKERAEAIVKEKINSSLIAYQRKYDQGWERFLENRSLNGSDSQGISTDSIHLEKNISSKEPVPDDGTPSAVECQFELMGLVFLAGQLGLEGVHDEIKQIAQQGLMQRDACYDLGKADILGFTGWFGAGWTLYNRQILAVGLAGTAGSSRDMSEILSSVGVNVLDTKLTSFDAVVTTLDFRARTGTIPPDFRHGSMEVHYVQEISDDQFEALLQEVGRL